jgi:hypothetical protein
VRDRQTSPHRPRLVVSRSTCPPISPPSPRTQLCTRSCSNKHTHTRSLVQQKRLVAHSLVRDGPPSPRRPRLVISRSTVPVSLSMSVSMSAYVRNYALPCTNTQKNVQAERSVELRTPHDIINLSHLFNLGPGTICLCPHPLPPSPPLSLTRVTSETSLPPPPPFLLPPRPSSLLPPGPPLSLFLSLSFSLSLSLSLCLSLYIHISRSLCRWKGTGDLGCEPCCCHQVV